MVMFQVWAKELAENHRLGCFELSPLDLGMRMGAGGKSVRYVPGPFCQDVPGPYHTTASDRVQVFGLHGLIRRCTRPAFASKYESRLRKCLKEGQFRRRAALTEVLQSRTESSG
jgi:hypothetical protein